MANKSKNDSNTNSKKANTISQNYEGNTFKRFARNNSMRLTKEIELKDGEELLCNNCFNKNMSTAKRELFHMGDKYNSSTTSNNPMKLHVITFF